MATHPIWLKIRKKESSQRLSTEISKILFISCQHSGTVFGPWLPDEKPIKVNDFNRLIPDQLTNLLSVGQIEPRRSEAFHGNGS